MTTRLPKPADRVRCPKCARVCANQHGYVGHWALRHWQPNGKRPDAVPAPGAPMPTTKQPPR